MSFEDKDATNFDCNMKVDPIFASTMINGVFMLIVL
jgi:hypothetical protein